MKKANIIPFYKMHALGNDFVIINNVAGDIKQIEQLPFMRLANRHLGIGFDQLLVVERAEHADFACRIFNADGSLAENCGNGLRCVARLLHEAKLCGDEVTFATKGGMLAARIKNYDAITISMGVPIVENKLFKLRDDCVISLISLGNPHAILKVNSLQDERVLAKGKYIYEHQSFPHGVNVGLMEVVDDAHIKLKTLERGVGETFACGSNACAAACAGIVNDWIQQKVKVSFTYGSLMIDWQGGNEPMHMTGPATYVFSGVIAV